MWDLIIYFKMVVLILVCKIIITQILYTIETAPYKLIAIKHFDEKKEQMKNKKWRDWKCIGSKWTKIESILIKINQKNEITFKINLLQEFFSFVRPQINRYCLF